MAVSYMTKDDYDKILAEIVRKYLPRLQRPVTKVICLKMLSMTQQRKHRA